MKAMHVQYFCRRGDLSLWLIIIPWRAASFTKNRHLLAYSRLIFTNCIMTVMIVLGF